MSNVLPISSLWVSGQAWSALHMLCTNGSRTMGHMAESNQRHLKVDEPAPFSLAQQSACLEHFLGCRIPWKVWHLGGLTALPVLQNLMIPSCHAQWAAWAALDQRMRKPLFYVQSPGHPM